MNVSVGKLTLVPIALFFISSCLISLQIMSPSVHIILLAAYLSITTLFLHR